jgi:hypothetical protein
MAKTPTAPTPPAPPAPPVFAFDDDLPIPAAAGSRGAGGEETELAKKLKAVPVSKSFIEKVTVAATITDPAEREKDFKAQCKTVINRVGGAIRRLRKVTEYANRQYAVRTVADEKLGFGVRIWREADKAA